MKKLRSYLIFSYVLLIVLLLLNNCTGCSEREPEPEPEPYTEEPAEPTAPDDETAQERAEQIGNDGDIKITLLWDFPGDVDLHVMQPNGNELSFRNMSDSRTGGRLDVDNRQGGRGSAENIYWRNPPAGRYIVEVEMYATSSAAPNGGPVKVVVKNSGSVRTYSARLTYDHQTVRITEFNYTPQ